MLRVYVATQVALFTVLSHLRPGRPDGPDDRGQATAEYALVLLGAAAVALLLVAWATKTGRITRLLDGVLDSILDRI